MKAGSRVTPGMNCWNGGRDCDKKRRYEGEGCVSLDYVLPDNSVSQTVKDYMEQKRRL